MVSLTCPGFLVPSGKIASSCLRVASRSHWAPGQTLAIGTAGVWVEAVDQLDAVWNLADGRRPIKPGCTHGAIAGANELEMRTNATEYGRAGWFGPRLSVPVRVGRAGRPAD